MMTLARMLYSPLPMANDWVKALTAAFDDLYATMPTEHTAAIDEMLMITPLRCARMTGNAYLHANMTLLRFVAKMRSHTSSVIVVGPRSPAPMPTLLWRMSIRPNDFTQASIIPAHAVSDVTSASCAIPRPPSATTISSVSSADFSRR